MFFLVSFEPLGILEISASGWGQDIKIQAKEVDSPSRAIVLQFFQKKFLLCVLLSAHKSSNPYLF